jgi:hypothetical protein
METTTSLNPNYSYTLKELAFIWNLSVDSVTRLVEDEPGTLVFQMQSTGRRLYRTFRVPGKVALRIQNRMTVVST